MLTHAKSYLLFLIILTLAKGGAAVSLPLIYQGIALY